MKPEGAIPNQNYFQVKINVDLSRKFMFLSSPNTFVFSTSLNNLKIKMYKTIMLPVLRYVKGETRAKDI